MTNGEPDDRINVNTADEWLLTGLEGVGESLARRIIEYRETVHPFEEVIELAAVPGISERMVRSWADRVTVGEPPFAGPQVDDMPSSESPLVDDEAAGIYEGLPDERTGPTPAELPHALPEEGADETVKTPAIPEPLAEGTSESAMVETEAQAVDGDAASSLPAEESEPVEEHDEMAVADVPGEGDDVGAELAVLADEPEAAPEEEPLVLDEEEPADAGEEDVPGAPTPATEAEAIIGPARLVEVEEPSVESPPEDVPAIEVAVPTGPPPPLATGPRPEALPAPGERRASVLPAILGGALLGLILTLGALWLLNGGLTYGLRADAERAARAGEAMGEELAAAESTVAALNATADALGVNAAVLATQAADLSARAERGAAQQSALLAQFEAQQGAVATLQAEAADLVDSVARLSGVSERAEQFLQGLRDLMVAVEGLPPTPTPTPTPSVTPTATPTAVPSRTPTVSATTATPAMTTPAGTSAPATTVTATPRGAPTRTPIPTTTPFGASPTPLPSP